MEHRGENHEARRDLVPLTEEGNRLNLMDSLMAHVPMN